MGLRALGYQLYACGRKGLPKQITLDGKTYHLRQVFKHDFFAATALYEKDRQQESESQYPPKIILKINRQEHFLGLPLAWLGELFCRHQISILRHLSDVPGIPRFLSRYGRTGFTYEYIEGRCLDGQQDLSEDFFDELLGLIKEVHRRNIAYLDMNKRDNIIVGDDSKPHLIDFQISLYIDERALISRRLSGYLRESLQSTDIYHVFKHKRWLRPELLKPHEKALSHHSSSKLIKWHRLAAWPFRKLRRRFLGYLVSKGILNKEECNGHNGENGQTNN